MNSTPRALLAATLLLSASAVAAVAQTNVPWSPMPNPDPRIAEAMAKMRTSLTNYGNVAISPDGALIAYTRFSKDGDAFVLAPYPASGAGKEKLVTIPGTKDCSSSDPVWSPDSQTLAFTSDCLPVSASDKTKEANKQAEIFLYSRATGQVRQLTHITGLFDSVAFSPSGSALAFLFVENATRSAGALDAMKPWSGVIGEDGIEVQRLYSVSASTGEGGFVSPAGLHVFEFNWAPTSPAFTYIAANPPGENNWWVAKLYLQQKDTTPQVIFDPNTTKTALHGLQIAVPRFSPDGSRIAFIGGLMSDQGSTGGDVWVVPARGGDPVDITPKIDGTPTWETWLDNKTVGFAEDRAGHTLLTDADADKHAVIPGSSIDLGEVSVGGGPIKDAFSFSNTGVLAMTVVGHNQAPEVYAGEPHALKPFTLANANTKAPARTESIEWTSEGFHVQGWLSYPVDYDPSKKYPLIVQVHGGPSASAGARYGGSIWGQLGYFQFSPNPRGSFGEGEKFTAANIKDFGYGDLRDILAGVDAVEKKVSIDKNREGLMGWSYGGFMTMFGVTQTHRFRAAIAGAGISDWKSYYGENSIDQWMVPFFGHTVYDDPAVYAKSSAIEYIRNVKTPTLVVVGDRDGECPAPQSFEFWHALRAEGVTTQLVVYPNEGHGFRDPAHQKDLYARYVAWFTKYMPPS